MQNNISLQKMVIPFSAGAWCNREDACYQVNGTTKKNFLSQEN